MPPSKRAQVIVVDNGSIDRTPDLVAALGGRFGQVEVICVSEPRVGKSVALNRAVAASSGSVLLFTDDDVRPPQNWIEAMCKPIWSGKADAVAGGLRLSPEVARSAADDVARSWLATTEHCRRPHDPPLIGANMAVSRRVFDVVPQFDPEVGPGATGHAEDTLFWLQVRAAGFRIVSCYDVVAEHHPDPARATWRGMARQAEKRGEFAAYLDHHWEHNVRRHPYLGLARATAKLWGVRLRRLPRWIGARAMSGWEAEALEHYHFRRRLLIERRRTPNYDPYGFVKRAGLLPIPPSAAIGAGGSQCTGTVAC